MGLPRERSLLNPVFREFSERDVVHEERRLRTDTQPSGLFGEAFQNMAYIAHPYRNPVVGWPTDIDATVRAEVLDYFKTYYALRTTASPRWSVT
ncbi:MAG: hypothetical protein U1E76_19335 [Planctomycetota bacterium]